MIYMQGGRRASPLPETKTIFNSQLRKFCFLAQAPFRLTCFLKLKRLIRIRAVSGLEAGFPHVSLQSRFISQPLETSLQPPTHRIAPHHGGNLAENLVVTEEKLPWPTGERVQEEFTSFFTVAFFPGLFFPFLDFFFFEGRRLGINWNTSSVNCYKAIHMGRVSAKVVRE